MIGVVVGIGIGLGIAGIAAVAFYVWLCYEYAQNF